MSISKSEEDYQNLSHEEQILLRPSQYIGSARRIDREVYAFSGEQFIPIVIDMPVAMNHIFLEILANACDNIATTRDKKFAPGMIEVDIGNTSIRIKNEGEPIPVIPKTLSPLVYIADMIFGNLCSGSNYDDTKKRTVIGQNGYGAKLTNLMSKKFRVRIGDPGFADRKNYRTYEKTWLNNKKESKDAIVLPPHKIVDGKIVNEPIEKAVNPYTGTAYVEVYYEIDFNRFKMNDDDVLVGGNEYTNQEKAVFKRAALEASMLCKVPVAINNEKYDFSNVKEFAKLWFGKDYACKSFHFISGKIQDTAKIEKDVISGKLEPNYNIYFFDAPLVEGSKMIFSYANRMPTEENGVHVNKVLHALKKSIKTVYNLDAKNLDRNIAMILVCQVTAPEYSSQMKAKLSNYKGSREELVFPQKDFIELMKMENFKEYLAKLQNESKEKPSKVNGKFERHVNFKGRDANDAGHKDKNAGCVLMIVEGNSASGYADKRRTLSVGGNDKNGYIIFKGKVLNIDKATQDKIDLNKEFTDLKLALGLRETDSKGKKVEIDYSNVKERCKYLRYGAGVISLVDPDSDGMHINCLLLNYFSKFGNFLNAGLFKFLRPPIIRAKSTSTTIAQRFYDISTFTLRMKEIRNKIEKKIKLTTEERNLSSRNVTFEYFKGLGTCEKALIEDDMEHALLLDCKYDEKTPEMLSLCFSKERANDRKNWIARQRQMEGSIYDKNKKDIEISVLVDRGMRDYNLDSLRRALPCNLDGWKESQRKIVYVALKSWNYGKSERPMKTGVFASKVSAETHYQHGEKSLADAVNKMAQDFKGSNNLNWFFPKGDFGDYKGNAPAASRYTHVYPEKWVKYAYEKDLIELVPKVMSEDEEVEPEWIPCDLPPFINCIRGIATGFSTFIPPHSAIDACEMVIEYCLKGNLRNFQPLKPHIEKFKGIIDIEEPNISHSIDEHQTQDFDSHESEKSEDDIEIEDFEAMETQDEFTTIRNFINRKKGKKMVTHGIYIEKTPEGRSSRRDIIFKELPYGYTANAFEKRINDIIAEKEEVLTSAGRKELKSKEIILDKRDESTIDDYQFVAIGYDPKKAGQGQIFTYFRLKTVFGLSNMIMIDKEGIPFHYKTVEEIFMSWAREMKNLYGKLKEKRLSDMKNDIAKFDRRRRFMELIVSGKIISNQKREIYKKILEENNLDIGIMKEVSWDDSSKEEIENLRKKIAEMEKAIIELERTKATDIWLKRVIVLKNKLLELGKTASSGRELNATSAER